MKLTFSGLERVVALVTGLRKTEGTGGRLKWAWIAQGHGEGCIRETESTWNRSGLGIGVEVKSTRSLWAFF